MRISNMLKTMSKLRKHQIVLMSMVMIGALALVRKQEP